jgi:hypothetical protein
LILVLLFGSLNSHKGFDEQRPALACTLSNLRRLENDSSIDRSERLRHELKTTYVSAFDGNASRFRDPYIGERRSRR